jgi:hypothetical protein
MVDEHILDCLDVQQLMKAETPSIHDFLLLSSEGHLLKMEALGCYPVESLFVDALR